MNITAIDPVTQTDALTNLGSDRNILGKEDFLNLLITQLQHQDPLDPTDSVEFTAQLAQFSSLEQLGNINENMNGLINSQQTVSNAQAVAYIGKSVTALGNGIQLQNGQALPCHFELSANADLVGLNIYDATGEFVKHIEATALAAGPQTLLWDGTDKDGNLKPDGYYTFEVLAVDAEDNMLDVQTFSSGIVSRVSFADGKAYLAAGQMKIALSDVLEVSEIEQPIDDPDHGIDAYIDSEITGGK